MQSPSTLEDTCVICDLTFIPWWCLLAGVLEQYLIPTPLTCVVDWGTPMLSRGGVWRRPLAEQVVNAVGVPPQGSQGQWGSPCLVPLVHISLPLQQHLEGLSVTMVRLQGGTLNQWPRCRVGVCWSSFDALTWLFYLFIYYLLAEKWRAITI